MSYAPGEDAEGLRLVVRDFLAKTSGEDDVRRIMSSHSGFDDTVWKRAAAMGLQGLVVPECHGGAGATPVELGVVFEEMGARLFTGPFFATVALAAPVLQALDSGSHLQAIAAGDLVATLAWSGSRSSSSTLRATAGSDGQTWSIAGTADTVVDGALADVLLVAARAGTGLAVFVVDGDAPGLTRTPLEALDGTRRLAEVRFADTPAQLLASDAAPALDHAGDLAVLYLAAEQLGGAQRVLDTATEYARTRVQFGRAIGSFQAIKHKLADMLCEVESVRSVVYHGLWTATHEPAGLPVSAALARSVAADAYQRLAAENIQVHGGVGFTWEHSAHLYLKRAKSSQLLLDTPTNSRARLAGLIGIGEGDVPQRRDGPADDELGAATDVDDAILQFLTEHPVPAGEDVDADRVFREALFDDGLAVVHFASGFGGRGLDSALQARVASLLTRAGAVDHTARNVIGLGMAIPTIHAHGSNTLKTRYLRPCFSGEHIWCQLFSEPGAGSDLAALSTRAERDDDHFVLNGQKVWTSLGHVADYAILLARTDPGVPKHRGLTFFVLDMRTPGVDVRPLRQLTGEAEFNEVYLTDVRIPAENVVGEVGEGWKVAMTTLASERATLGSHQTRRGDGPIGQAVQLYGEAAAANRADAVVLERLMSLWTRAEAARLTNIRVAALPGRAPGPEGSIGKLQMAELNKAIYELCVDLSGSAGLLIDSYADVAPEHAAVHGGTDVRKAYLRSLANSIEGGTSEVMRNILGERVLGLPPEPRADRDVAWKDTVRA